MKWLLALSLCLSVPAAARELEGVNLPERVQLENAALQLNGSGLRSILFFRMYVAGLYLERKASTVSAVLADRGFKRIALHVLAGEGETERFLSGFRKGIAKNHAESEMAALHSRMAAFDRMFDAVSTVKKNDVIAFDWLPGIATRVSLNGRELGRIEGDDFYRALLAIWLGDKPVDENLKRQILGL
jgi:Chalcone isomerase-like